MVALVGPSGAGKSTLVNLIPRFFDVTAGRILIDGHDLRDVSSGSLRAPDRQRHAGDDSLQRHGAQQHRLWPAGRAASSRWSRPRAGALAHDFIERMPEGYDTVIGEKGFRLSGGERQRIAIARALLKDAPILILDEATSALDAESESLVQAALSNLMQGRTVVRHRPSAIHRPPRIRIAVIEDGRITAIGLHEELLRVSLPTSASTNCSLPTTRTESERARNERRSRP